MIRQRAKRFSETYPTTRGAPGGGRRADSVPVHALCWIYHGRGFQREWRVGTGGVEGCSMKLAWFHFVVSAVLFSSFAGAQSSDTAAKKQGPEDGTIVDNIYSNECLGFSLPIPA